MADALNTTEEKSNKFQDLYEQYDEKIQTLRKKIKRIKEKYKGNQEAIDFELARLSQTEYNNIPLDEVYSQLLIKQEYIVNALTSPYIKTRGHRLGETIGVLEKYLKSTTLGGMFGSSALGYGLGFNEVQNAAEHNPLVKTDAEDQIGVSTGLWDYFKTTFFPHIAPRFSNSDGNGLYKPNEYYDTDFNKKIKDHDENYPLFFKDQNVDEWGRDHDHEYFNVPPHLIINSASDESIIKDLEGDNLGKNTVVTPPPVGQASDGGKSTEVINTNIKKKSDNSQVTSDTTYKGAVAASTTIDDSESENTIPKRVQLMSSSIKENPSRIQEDLMKDSRWSPDRLAKLRIKDQDFQKAKKNKDLMIAFNKNKASGAYS